MSTLLPEVNPSVITPTEGDKKARVELECESQSRKVRRSGHLIDFYVLGNSTSIDMTNILGFLHYLIDVCVGLVWKALKTYSVDAHR